MRARFSLLGAFVGMMLACLGGLPAGALAAPTIEQQWVSGVSERDATLNAEINPNGEQTYYELQIDTTGNFSFYQNTSCPISIAPMICLQVIVPGDPLPPGLVQPPEFVLPAGDDTEPVSVNMNSIGATLQPSTTYHYRVIATHAMGPIIEGPEQTFTTPPATSAPTIDGQWVTGATEGDATLHALINPNGLLTKYELQIDTTGNFNFFQTSSCPLNVPGVLCAAVIVPGDPLAPGLVQPPEFSLPAGYGSQQVSVNMASIGATLQPGTTYYYRALAANGLPFVEGPTQTFVTPSSIEDPPEEPPEDGSLPPDEGVSQASDDEEKEKEGGQRAVVPAPPLGIAPTAQGNRSKRAHRRNFRRCVRKVRKRAHRRGRRLSRRGAQRRCARSRHQGSNRRVGIASRIALSN